MHERLLGYLLAWILCTCSTIQASDNNVLLPNAEFSLTPLPIGDFGAFSFFGELGAKNLRGSGTYGVYFTNCQRFKATGEFLTQKLKYNFFSKHKTKWVSQYAVGGAYQYLLPQSIFQSIDLGASYSHAFHRNISANRSIAGSDGAASYFGSTIKLWKCAFVSGAANYDYVKYHRHLESPRLANGWGGSVNLIQQLPKNLSLTLSSEFRKPFYFYEGTIGWTHQFRTWEINCGLYGNYTDGKHGLPNVTSGGIQLGVSFGGNNRKCCRSSQTSTSEQASSWSQNCYGRTFCDLANWVSTPAVYEPVVVAIADAKHRSKCTAPTSSAIPDQIAPAVPFPIPIDIQTGSFFQSNSPLTFSATGLPAGTSINPSTGEITGSIVSSGPFFITVTATTSCGSTSQSFTLTSSG